MRTRNQFNTLPLHEDVSVKHLTAKNLELTNL